MLKTILFSILILQSISTEEEDTLSKDIQKCMQPVFTGKVTTEACNEMTESLESTGDFEGKCCKMTLNIDALVGYKRMFGEDWKSKICEEFDLDEDLSEDEIREKLALKNEQNICSVITKIGKNVGLYTVSLQSIDGEVKYDCGDGEETFNSKDFVPTTDFEKTRKDMADCGVPSDEKSCSKKSGKLLTDDAQCCWCDTSSIGGDLTPAFSTQMCVGYPTVDLEDMLKGMVESNQDAGMKIKTECSCLDKKGKSTSILINSSTGEVIIE